LISPVIDLSMSSDPVLEYARWFSNDDRDADRLDVEISNNDGGIWVLVESVPDTSGWVLKKFTISDFVIPTALMRIRFSATDNPNDSVTEAAIDAFEVYDFKCVDSPVIPIAGTKNCIIISIIISLLIFSKIIASHPYFQIKTIWEWKGR